MHIMNPEDTPQTPSALNPPAAHFPPTPPAAPAKRRRWRDPVLLLAGALIAVMAWQWIDMRQSVKEMREQIALRFADIDSLGQEARTLTKQNQEVTQNLQAKLGALESRQAESQSQQAALESLYQEFSRARDDRALADIEQAIVIAAQQLDLASNVPAALAALQSADARLAKLDRPRLLPLRKLLTRDIERLKALPTADIASMAVQLDSMLGRIDELPMGFEHSPAAPAPVTPPKHVATSAKNAAKPSQAASAPLAAAPVSEDKPNVAIALGKDLWNDFRQLIRIERLDRPDPALLAPQQAAYLRENLRLRLLTARLALLQRDGKVFNEDVAQARQWLGRYFDTQAPAVQSMMNKLREIEGARLAIELPSLADTQDAIRALSAR